MRYLLLLLALLAGCYVHTSQPGQCLAYLDSTIQVTDRRGATMVYIRDWNEEKKEWSGKYPADIWYLMGWDSVECPVSR